MKRSIPSIGISGEGGFTLVELMVALAIGLFLLFGMGTLYFSNKESFLAQQQLGDLQENARLVSVLLAQNVQHAGYHIDPNKDPATLFPSSSPAITGTGTATNTAQTVTVAFQAEGELSDCVGDMVGNASSPQLVSNAYRLDASTNELQCRTSDIAPAGGASQWRPLVDNVTAMVVRYGVDSDQDGSANRYVWAGDVTDWDNVVSVRMALLLCSGKPVKPTASTGTFDLLGQSVTTPSDRLARRVVNLTIALPNRLHRIVI